jgi:hypothetical protein
MTDPDLPLWYRVATLGVERRNDIGHAEFDPGEVRQLLVDQRTGVIPTASSVSRAIARAKEKGYLAEESSVRCIVTRIGVQGGNSTTYCRFHGIGRARPQRTEVVSITAIRAARVVS